MNDTTRLDWMERMRRDCEGRVLTMCFLPGDQTLRENIDEIMKVNPLPSPPPGFGEADDAENANFVREQLGA
jgi:hypothetical protein